MALAQVATLYASLLSAYSNGIGTELSGSGYSGRAAVPAFFDPATGNFYTEGVSFGPGTGAWTAAPYLGLYDASSAGNLLLVVPITSFTGASGTSLSIPAGAITISNPVLLGGTTPDFTAQGAIFGPILPTSAVNNAIVPTGGNVIAATGVTLTATTFVATVAATPTVVTYSATPTVNAALGNNAKITLTGNITTLTLSGAQPGQRGYLWLIQDGTGSRLLSAVAASMKFKGGAKTLTTTASATDLIEWTYDGTAYWCDLNLAYA